MNTKNSTVKVTADELGNVIGISINNPEYGYVRVEQVGGQFREGGWFSMSRRSALIKGKVEDLQAAGFEKDQEIPGKIIVKESLTPFNPENPEKNLKIAGESGIICRFDDQPIYRDSFFTTDMDAKDTLIAHTNGEEISESLKLIRGTDNTALAAVGRAKLG